MRPKTRAMLELWLQTYGDARDVIMGIEAAGNSPGLPSSWLVPRSLRASLAYAPAGPLGISWDWFWTLATKKRPRRVVPVGFRHYS